MEINKYPFAVLVDEPEGHCFVCKKKVIFLEKYQITIYVYPTIAKELVCRDCYHWYKDIKHFYEWSNRNL
jgi:hypothetical protein